MEELIKINFENQMISARDLYSKVGSTERFSSWFERQLKFGFEENEDYIGCKFFNTHANQELQDYNLTMDMAKQICMVQKTEESKKIRKYLIDLEKAWNTPEQIMARALRVAETTINSLSMKIEQQEPLVKFAEHVSESTNSISIGDFSKIVSDENIRVGRNRMFVWLKDNGYIMKGNNVPYQKYIDNNMFEVIEQVFNTPYGTKTGTKTLITGKGQIHVMEKLREEFGEL